MLTDNNQRLDAGSVSRNIASSLTDNYYDLSTVRRLISDGRDVRVTFAVTEAFAGDAGATVELQVVAMPAVAPVRSSATVTFDATGGAIEDMVAWTAHGHKVGTPVVFTGSGTVPTGLTKGVTYFVIEGTADAFQVATTLENALDGTEVQMTGDGTATITGTAWPDGLAGAVTFDATGGTVEDMVTWTAHGFAKGTPIRFTTGDSGVMPTGLTEDTIYYVAAPSTNYFQVSTSLANALLPTPTVVNFSDDGTALLNAIAYPYVLASSGEIPLTLLTLKSIKELALDPVHFIGTTAGGLQVPGGRYVYGRVLYRYPGTAPAPKAKPRVQFDTSYGSFVVELEPDLAPATVATEVIKMGRNRTGQAFNTAW